MPLSFPENLPVRVDRLERLLNQLYTSSQTRPAQDTIRAAALTIGDPAGPHIKLIPTGDDGAEVWLIPAAGAEPTRLVADVTTGYPSEATFHVLSAAGSTSAEFNVASGEINMSVHNADGSGEAGGQAYWGYDLAAFGYINGSTNNFFRFSPSSISSHVGQWNDYGQPLGSSAGIVPGSLTVPGGNSFWGVSYPASMASNMGPVATVRRSTPNFYWCLTASSTSGFTMSQVGTESFAIYFWSFRH
ncbi:hypothetical protein ABT340_39700 [Streptosporangium sp. NPDC000239]|uniref:hypothetical protein n=1 Tax=Streptosporangium sp. NPDC000239 TaxID=3154248 RepID=UPI00331E336A